MKQSALKIWSPQKGARSIPIYSWSVSWQTPATAVPNDRREMPTGSDIRIFQDFSSGDDDDCEDVLPEYSEDMFLER